MHYIVPPEGNVLVLWLLSGWVKDTLPTFDLHADIQLKVNVSLGCRAAEAAVGGGARPALAEQLTHSRETRGLPVRSLAEEREGKRSLFRNTTETRKEERSCKRAVEYSMAERTVCGRIITTDEHFYEFCSINAIAGSIKLTLGLKVANVRMLATTILMTQTLGKLKSGILTYIKQKLC